MSSGSPALANADRVDKGVGNQNSKTSHHSHHMLPGAKHHLGSTAPSEMVSGSAAKLRNGVEPAVRPCGCERSSLSGVRNCILEA